MKVNFAKKRMLDSHKGTLTKALLQNLPILFAAFRLRLAANYHAQDARIGKYTARRRNGTLPASPLLLALTKKN